MFPALALPPAATRRASVATFAGGRASNILQGAVHVVLFAAFVMLIFQD